MDVRKAIFWLHLFCGVLTGIVVFIMSITGVALTYQKQMTEWADHRLYRIKDSRGAAPLSPEALIGGLREAMPGAIPMTLTIYSDPSKAAEVSLGPNGTVFLNRYTGEVLGQGSRGIRTFFRVMTDWHRWLGFSGEKRGIGRAVTGVCNLAFLFLAISGLYLWWPQKWSRQVLRATAWFRRSSSSKARDYNWHHVFGFWLLVPLILILASGAVISYPWASNLVFRIAGSQPPPQMGRPGPGRPGMEQGQAPRPLQPEGLDTLTERAREMADGWRTLTISLPRAGDKTVSFTLDKGSGGQPHLRSTFVLDRSTGEVVRSEGFRNLDKGLRARLWLRFVHTGEYYGLTGQTIAGIASAAGVILVYTGIALSWRRYVAWLRRRSGMTAESA